MEIARIDDPRPFASRFSGGLTAGNRVDLALNRLVLDALSDRVIVADTNTPSNGFSGTMAEAVAAGVMTYAAPSSKLVRNASGILVAGTSLRVDHDAAGNPLGLLIEDQATNLVEDSRSFENGVSGWSNTQPTSYSGADLHGGHSAAVMTMSTGGEASPYCTCTVVASTVYTFSFDAYLGSLPASDFTFAVYDVTNGSFIDADIAPADPLTTVSQRVSHTFTTPSGCTSVRCYLFRNANVSVGGTIVFDNVQLEAGSSASSRIITAGATVTRAADIIDIPAGRFPWNDDAGTFALSVEPRASVYAMLAGNSAPGWGPRHQLNFTSSVALQYSIATGSAQAGLFAPDGATMVAAAYAADDVAMTADSAGGVVYTDTDAAMPTGIDTIMLGRNESAGSILNGRVRRLSYVPERLPDADLLTLVG